MSILKVPVCNCFPKNVGLDGCNYFQYFKNKKIAEGVLSIQIENNYCSQCGKKLEECEDNSMEL